jgi:hypothetical protein
LLALATALVILADAVIVVAPGALADPQPTTTPAKRVAFAVITPTDGPTPSPWLPAPTYFIPVPSPTPAPPTPMPTPTPTPTPAPTYRDTVANAKAYVKTRLGAAQYNCIDNIFTHESKWNPLSGSPTGPYGIPQANPGSKMASYGSNWRTSPLTQVKWGIWYMYERYGSGCGAWSFWQDHGWY